MKRFLSYVIVFLSCFSLIVPPAISSDPLFLPPSSSPSVTPSSTPPSNLVPIMNTWPAPPRSPLVSWPASTPPVVGMPPQEAVKSGLLSILDKLNAYNLIKATTNVQLHQHHPFLRGIGNALILGGGVSVAASILGKLSLEIKNADLKDYETFYLVRTIMENTFMMSLFTVMASVASYSVVNPILVKAFQKFLENFTHSLVLSYKEQAVFFFQKYGPRVLTLFFVIIAFQLFVGDTLSFSDWAINLGSFVVVHGLVTVGLSAAFKRLGIQLFVTPTVPVPQWIGGKVLLTILTGIELAVTAIISAYIKGKLTASEHQTLKEKTWPTIRNVLASLQTTLKEQFSVSLKVMSANKRALDHYDTLQRSRPKTSPSPSSIIEEINGPFVNVLENFKSVFFPEDNFLKANSKIVAPLVESKQKERDIHAKLTQIQQQYSTQIEQVLTNHRMIFFQHANSCLEKENYHSKECENGEALYALWGKYTERKLKRREENPLLVPLAVCHHNSFFSETETGTVFIPKGTSLECDDLLLNTEVAAVRFVKNGPLFVYEGQYFQQVSIAYSNFNLKRSEAVVEKIIEEAETKEGVIQECRVFPQMRELAQKAYRHYRKKVLASEPDLLSSLKSARYGKVFLNQTWEYTAGLLREMEKNPEEKIWVYPVLTKINSRLWRLFMDQEVLFEYPLNYSLNGPFKGPCREKNLII